MPEENLLDKIFWKNRRRVNAYKMLFDIENPTVRIVLQDMCKAHSVFDGGFSVEPYQHAFNAGERNVVLRILTILGMTEEDIIKLSEEETHAG